MNTKGIAILFISIVLIHSCRNAEKDSTSVIAFGSCNKTFLDQNMWPDISASNPDLFIWLGDIVYADTHNMAVLQSKYQTQKDNPLYKDFAESTKVIGVWDDHDYGVSDGGKFFSKKDESKDVLLEFLDTPVDDPVRSHSGAYSKYELENGTNLVKVLLLDARYFRDTVIHSEQKGVRYDPNPEGDILGEQQWNWLEKQLSGSTADVHIIGSGIQMISKEHGFEKWANFPTARKRFFDLLEDTRPNGLILISGDRHIGELSKIQLENGQSLYEITSSGLTHTWSETWEESNQYRIGDLVIARNFGLIKVDWSENPIQVELEIRGLSDTLYKAHKILL